MLRCLVQTGMTQGSPFGLSLETRLIGSVSTLGMAEVTRAQEESLKKKR